MLLTCSMKWLLRNGVGALTLGDTVHIFQGSGKSYVFDKSPESLYQSDGSQQVTTDWPFAMTKFTKSQVTAEHLERALKKRNQKRVQGPDGNHLATTIKPLATIFSGSIYPFHNSTGHGGLPLGQTVEAAVAIHNRDPCHQPVCLTFLLP